MSYDLTGRKVVGKYMGMFPFTGVVTETRVKYGGKLQHTVQLNEEIVVFGAERDVVLMDTEYDNTTTDGSDFHVID